MEKQVLVTKDGSHTIVIPELNVMYHSVHGAIGESMHVYVQEGLLYTFNQTTSQTINIFEMGFGTGLNALLTAVEAEKLKQAIHYASIEAFPISINEARLLNYGEILGQPELFRMINECEWNKDVAINEYFTLHKINGYLFEQATIKQINLIYYDAFAPTAQPELWTKEVFEHLYKMLLPGGSLVTYCSKGDVRRAMMAAGFTVKKLQGPPGKREMLRAIKT